jgi:hypothetical protein
MWLSGLKGEKINETKKIPGSLPTSGHLKKLPIYRQFKKNTYKTDYVHLTLSDL